MQKVDRWFPRVEEGAEVFIQKLQKDEKEAMAERHRTVATATLTGGASTRAQEERGGGEGREPGKGVGSGEQAACPTD